MIANYIKIALRNLVKNRLYSLINITGLAVGLASCLLISLFVRFEFSYDSSFTDADSIYRLSPDFAASSMGPERHPAGNVAALAPLVVRNSLPGIMEIARIGGMHALIARENVVFYEDAFRWADPAIFSIFDFEWLQGDPETALQSPDSVVISQSIARKYFGDEDPLGQTLLLENTWPITVTGVLADIPENSHLSLDLVVPMDTAWEILGFDYSNNWAYVVFHTYVRLQEGVNIDDITNQIEDVVMASIDSGVADFFSISPSTFGLTPINIQDIHLRSGRRGELKEPGSLSFVLGFSAIAGCLLLIACFNFMNLSMSGAMRRAREVGLRKVLGAQRKQLATQFIGETLLVTVIALVIGLALVEALRPTFGALVERPLETVNLFTPQFLLFIGLITCITALVAGSYPAFFLARLDPAGVFRARSAGAGRFFSMRNLLTMTQFALAIVLIIATAVVFLQMRYVRNAELGFNKDQVVVLWGTHADGLGSQWEILKQELRQHPEITHVTEADMYPGSVFSRTIRVEGSAIDNWNIQVKEIGFGFLEAYDIDVIAGRDFNEAISSDVFIPPVNVPEGQPTGAFILNATAVEELGLEPQEVIGRRLDVDFSSDFSLAVQGPIIGVVEDVHIESLRRPISPLVYFVPAAMWGDSPRFDVASVRIRGGDTQATVDYIRERWTQLIPEIPFNYHFLDTEFDLLYLDEARQGNLFTLFAVLTVLIACLGLFGLVSLAITQRRKEIGVRKVVGSSAWNILLLLSSDFSRLVLLANVIAWPVAYLIASQWLQAFAYRIDLTPLIFIGSGMVALCVAWVTVCSSAVRAAFENPVLALRYE